LPFELLGRCDRCARDARRAATALRAHAPRAGEAECERAVRSPRRRRLQGGSSLSTRGSSLRRRWSRAASFRVQQREAAPLHGGLRVEDRRHLDLGWLASRGGAGAPRRSLHTACRPISPHSSSSCSSETVRRNRSS
jgi:hypothetical protein